MSREEKARPAKTKTTGLLLLLLLFALPACSRGPAPAVDPARLLPAAVGDYRRTELITGAAARERIDSLHGKRIAVEAGAIASYRAPGRNGPPAMIWISRSRDAARAREQTRSMIARMTGNPRSPFHDLQTTKENGLTIYRFRGLGQAHYIFCRGRLVYWLSTPAAAGRQFLLAVLPPDADRTRERGGRTPPPRPQK